MKPVIALVGRPNVGKSTLFNRLTRSRAALVADYPGLTRDRHYGEGRMGDRPFLVIDTGGFEPVVKEGVLQEMAKQTKQAVAEADVVIFIVDGRQGITPHDKAITDYLRRCGRPVILAVNKAEGMKYTAVVADFYELGMGDPLVISSAHGDGVYTLLDEALKRVPEAMPETDDEAQAEQASIRLAIVGRPNVGKSTMINALLGEERVIAFDLPGTTRDAIEIPFERDGKHYTLVDTAGLRKRGKVFQAIEKFSVVKTLQAISEANVVLLLLDARQDISEQDAHIAGFVLESGRALVVGINKWDGAFAGQAQGNPFRSRAQAPFFVLCEIPLCFGTESDRYRLADAFCRCGLCGSHGEIADTSPDKGAGRSGRSPTAAASPGFHQAEIALCPSRRPKSAGDRDTRQQSGKCRRRLQTLSGKAFPGCFFAGGYAFANRIPLRKESVCKIIGFHTGLVIFSGIK